MQKNATFRNAFTVKVGEFVHQVGVFEEHGADGTGSQRVLIIVHGGASGGGKTRS
jgi:acetyl esterase/lipase